MESLDQVVKAGWEVRQRNFPPVIHFVTPRQTAPISVTGGKCELNCAHCGGHYLKSMKNLAHITDEKQLPASCLISGGCTAGGSVPLMEHVEKLAGLKQGRRFNLHLGLVGPDEFSRIAALADCVSFDFVGDNSTIREVFGLERTVDDYVRCYQMFKEKVVVKPHVCVGLHGGEIRGEYKALELLRELGAEGLTLIVFKPTLGSRYEKCLPPAMGEVVKLIAHARCLFPDIPLHLGCMRPGGSYRNELDGWAVRAGVNAIVNPAPLAVKQAGQLGLATLPGEECCSL